MSAQSELVRRAIEAHRVLYEELSDDWTKIDTKSQYGITLVGILLAGVVAFLTKGSESISIPETVLIVCEIILLALSGVMFVVALRSRNWEEPPYYGETQKRLKRGGEQQESEVNLEEIDRLDLRDWEVCTNDVQEQNRRKGNSLQWGQSLSLASLVLLAIFAILQVFGLQSHGASLSTAPPRAVPPISVTCRCDSKNSHDMTPTADDDGRKTSSGGR